MKSMIVLLASAYFCFLPAATIVSGAGSPTLLVPGFLCNQVDAKIEHSCNDHNAWCCDSEQHNSEGCDSRNQQSFAACKSVEGNWDKVWVPDELAPELMDCWIYKLGMVYQEVYSNNKGVQTSVPGFGDVSSVEYLGNTSFMYMHDLAKSLVNKGVSLKAAPYDWRLNPGLLEQSGYFRNVKQLIETMYKENDGSSVNIVAHSLGSNNILYFLANTVSQQWKEKYVKAFVTLSGVWKGGVIFLANLISGFSLDPSMSPLIMRSILRSIPASYGLLPGLDLWNKAHVVVETPTKNYTLYDMEDLFTDMGYPQGYEQYKAAPSFLVALPPPNVPVYCFYGTGMDTPIRLVYDDQFPDSQPTFVMGTGDGYVTDASLQACAIWKRLQNQAVETRCVPGMVHVTGQVTCSNPDVIQAVLGVV